jgi:long-chain acyl-CoA synthetase
MRKLEKLTIKCLLEQSVESFSQRPALAFVGENPISYAAVYEKVRFVSQLLHKQGIITGDRVAILGENMPNWGITFLAVTCMGCIAVPILPDFHSNEVNHIIKHAECKSVFVSKRLYEKLIEGEFEKSTTLILMDDFSLIPPKTKKDKLREAIKESGKEFAKLKEVALRFTKKMTAEVQEDDLASIVYTSGTTGHSKGVMLTHKNIISNAISAREFQEITENDRFISILPLSHTMECTVGFVIPLLNGAAVFYLDKPPIARVLLPAMEIVKPTMIVAVPLILEKIYKTRILPKFNQKPLIRKLYKVPQIRRRLHQIAGKKLLESFGGELRFFGIGGALLAPEVELFLIEAGFPYAIGYGLTETSPLVAGCGPGKTRYRSTGNVLLDVRVKIHNPDKVTGEGEILVKGPNVMKGYYKDPDRTTEVFTEDGWFKTGDLGTFDEDQYLYIKGRLKNVILGPSGENIYPEEIEAKINKLEHVLESLVFQEQGRLVARIHLDYERLDKKYHMRKISDSQIEQEIRDFLETMRQSVNSEVSTFSRINKVIEQVEPFEKTPTHKIKRYLYSS